MSTEDAGTPFTDLALARRLEAVDAWGAASCAEAWKRFCPTSGATWIEVAGGCAAYAGVRSPLTQALGLGMSGPVENEEFDRLEEFYFSRGCAVSTDLCPLADVSLLELVQVRGYRIVEFTHLLVKEIGAEERCQTAVRVERATEEQAELWSQMLVSGFLTEDEETENKQVGRSLFHRSGCLPLIGYLDGQPAGSADMAVRGGVAALFADSTLPEWRNRGVQTALIRERLAMAAEAGCDLAMASVIPGSVSNNNYQRAGFHVVYTRTKLVREPAD